MNESNHAVTAGNCCKQLLPKPAEIQIALNQQKQAIENLDKTAVTLRERLELVMDQRPPEPTTPKAEQRPSLELVSIRIRDNNEYITNVTAGLARIIERLQV